MTEKLDHSLIANIQNSILSNLHIVIPSLKQKQSVIDLAYQIALSSELDIPKARNMAIELYKCQDKNGSWNSEVWDTSIVLRSLKLFIGEKTVRDSMYKACGWLKTMRLENGSWHDDPWETMLATSALVGIDSQFCRKSIQWLEKLKDSSGLLVNLHYTAFYCTLLSDFIETIDKTEVQDLSDALQMSVRCVIDNLETSLRENWSVVFFIDFLNWFIAWEKSTISAHFREKILCSAVTYSLSSKLSLQDRLEILVHLVRFYKSQLSTTSFFTIGKSLQNELEVTLLDNIGKQITTAYMKSRNMIKKNTLRFLLGFYFFSALMLCIVIAYVGWHVEFAISMIFTVVLTTFIESNLRDMAAEIFRR